MTSSANVGNKIVVTLLVVVLILSLANLAITFWILRQASEPTSPSPTAPYCPAIPTKLILEDPQCADKLLRAMNATSVRIASGKVGVMSAEAPG